MTDWNPDAETVWRTVVPHPSASAWSRLRGCIAATIVPMPNGWERVEVMRYPDGTYGAQMGLDGKKRVAARVTFDWQPSWRKA